MLTCLRVRNLAIIDRLEIELGAGLNVVTGETGAGKSILVSSLQLVLGARARPEVVRTGCDAAEVEALFELAGDDPVRAVLAQEDLDTGDDELVLRRVVKAGGRSRATVNGRLATLAQLGRIARHLVDISSQHEHTTLVDAGTHLAYLDAFGDHDEALGTVAATYAALRTAAAEVEALRQKLADRVEREELLRFQLAEVGRVDPKPGELADLEVERERLRHGERLQRAAGRAAAALDEDGGMLDRLNGAVHEVVEAGRIDPALAELGERLDAVGIDLRELSYDLTGYVRDLDIEPERLLQVEERVQAIRRVLRRFAGDEAALLAFRDDAERELSGLDDLEAELARAETARTVVLEQATSAARALSARRVAVADRLAEAITAELHDLGMGHARVQVAVAPVDGPGAGPQVDGVRLTESGIDRVEFLIAPNPGEAPRPLAKVASGGELSRSLLALKRVLAGTGPVGLYVFDEVDTGVGGAIADAIGRKIREVSGHHQVLCITHQPQIAAFGDAHLHVRKEVVDGRTRSLVDVLRDGVRTEELARMLGGATVTAATLQAAADLLQAAQDPPRAAP